MANNAAKELAEEYLRLGGHRLLVMDDNALSTRNWEPDAPKAKTFWDERIEASDAKFRDEIISFLPSINAA